MVDFALLGQRVLERFRTGDLAEFATQIRVVLVDEYQDTNLLQESKVNEDLMDAFPRDRLSVLSIHQAKGLEFPLTIVDVGSDFRTNHKAHKFKRFPDEGSTPHTMEDYLRPHTDLKGSGRTGRDRAFDDLYRQFFVAYSRPQQILLLVGLTTNVPGDGNGIKNVATGWTRGGTMNWPVPIVRI
jgi:DNA helicase II / ATP-dependent DNA helicase PcrA